MAGRGAVQEQRQLLAELLGVGGAGLAGRRSEPRRKGLLVVAGEQAGRMLRVLDLDGGPDERTQGRVDVEDSEEPLAGCEVGAVEDLGQKVGIEPAQVLGDELVLAGEVLVQRALGHLCRCAELVDAGGVDALVEEKALRRAEDALARASAAAQASWSLLQLRHMSSVAQRYRPVCIARRRGGHLGRLRIQIGVLSIDARQTERSDRGKA